MWIYQCQILYPFLNKPDSSFCSSFVFHFWFIIRQTRLNRLNWDYKLFRVSWAGPKKVSGLKKQETKSCRKFLRYWLTLLKSRRAHMDWINFNNLFLLVCIFIIPFYVHPPGLLDAQKVLNVIQPRGYLKLTISNINRTKCSWRFILQPFH